MKIHDYLTGKVDGENRLFSGVPSENSPYDDNRSNYIEYQGFLVHVQDYENAEIYAMGDN